MRRAILLLLIIMSAAVAVAYTPDSYTSVDLNLSGGHTADPYGDVNLSLLEGNVVPVVALETANNTVTGDSTPTINYNFTDASSTADCTLYFDGAAVDNNGSSAQGSSESLTANTTQSDSSHWYWVSCDDGGAGVGTSANQSLTIDTTAGVVTLYAPANLSNTSDNTTSHWFSLNENGNCTLVYDGTVVATNNSVSSGVNTSLTPSAQNDGRYNWWVNCTDQASNYGVSANRTFWIDTTAPSITVNTANNTETSDYTPSINITVTDSRNATTACTLQFNSTSYDSNASVANNTATLLTANTTLLEGAHYRFNVSCTDGLNTASTSLYWLNTSDFESNFITINYCTGMTAFTIIPDNSTHKLAQPENQTSTVCMYNVTNNNTETNVSLRLKLNTSLMWYNTIPFGLMSDLDIENWDALKRVDTNTTWNWTFTCLHTGTSEVNFTQGSESMVVKYEFNDSLVSKEWYNASDANVSTQVTEYNSTFDCPSQNFVNLSSLNDTWNATSWDFTGYDTAYISYIFDSGGNNSVLLEIINSTGSGVNSSWSYLADGTSWTELSVNFTSIGTDIGEVKFWLNETITNSSGKFFLDNLYVKNNSANNFGLNIGLNATSNSTVTWLTTSYQAVTTLTASGWQGIWFWYNYTNPSLIKPYSFTYEVAIV